MTRLNRREFCGSVIGGSAIVGNSRADLSPARTRVQLSRFQIDAILMKHYAKMAKLDRDLAIQRDALFGSGSV